MENSYEEEEHAEHGTEENQETEHDEEVEQDDEQENVEQEGEEHEETEQNEEENNEEHEENEEENEQGDEDNEQNHEEQEEDNQENTANDSDDEEFTGFGDEETPSGKTSKKRQILSDDSDEGQKVASDDDNEELSKKKKKHKKHKKSHKKKKNRGDEEVEDGGGGGGEDEEGEEEENEQNQEEMQEELNDLNEDETAQQEDSDEGPDDRHISKKQSSDVVTNLDRVLSNQKAENKRKNRRKNKDSEELNEMDNTISSIIAEMKNVAAEDRAANEKGLTSIGKIKMLSTVIGLLHKSEYHDNMIDLGILHAIAEWLAPLPDRSLPNIKIREALIDALRDFGEIGADYLKTSGVGKAVMFLYKHPKEVKQNKQKLEKLIHNWSRPIFNLDSKQLSKEERLQRDIEQVRTMRRNSGDGQGQSVDEILAASDKKKRKVRLGNESDRSESDDPNKVLRPGDPGFVPRARVPIPSHKDYVIRPKSNLDVIEQNSKKAKKGESRLEKHQKKFVEFKRNHKFQRAVTLSSLWRNRLARSAVNRKVGGSNPPRDEFFLKRSKLKIPFNQLCFLHKLSTDTVRKCLSLPLEAFSGVVS
ncbi:unnamed protein product [Brachionus calyciflorus]|uniref:TFIIS N-terminal domain-containing protein n=1 Tax=Brachionus calyciflorus TaxID=104777 RepID=A0A813U7L5_9BILA|nr:unnamed protein product [Brachionus calyciflorus]